MLTIVDAEMSAIGDLLKKSNVYSVPTYQRDYKWSDTQIDQF